MVIASAHGGEGHYVDHAGSKLVPELGYRQPDPE